MTIVPDGKLVEDTVFVVLCTAAATDLQGNQLGLGDYRFEFRTRTLAGAMRKFHSGLTAIAPRRQLHSKRDPGVTRQRTGRGPGDHSVDQGSCRWQSLGCGLV